MSPYSCITLICYHFLASHTELVGHRELGNYMVKMPFVVTGDATEGRRGEEDVGDNNRAKTNPRSKSTSSPSGLTTVGLIVVFFFWLRSAQISIKIRKDYVNDMPYERKTKVQKL